ncbi:hypothetical protein [Propionivibrio sp.]|uniref:hypothetical protein n=1 Tax=Propionivibrio sp. TaxID=2212460 RepID=UPI0039E2EC57
MKSASEIRYESALELAECSGISYFNPFIGGSAVETCEKLNDGFEILHYLMCRDVFEGIRPGLSLLVQTMSAAVQFEVDVGRLNGDVALSQSAKSIMGLGDARPTEAKT